MSRFRILLLSTLALTLVLSACIPVSVPGLRNIDGQTWSSRFQVEAQVAGTTIRLPVEVALTFGQRLQEITADANIEYDAGIIKLQTGRVAHLDGRLGFDDHLSLTSSTNLLTFDGSFIGDRLTGRLALAGVVPVGDVTFTRSR